MPIDFDDKVLAPAYRIWGTAAHYAPAGGGAGTDVTVIRPDDEPPTTEEGGVLVASAPIVRHVRKSELAAVEEGATLAIGAATYRVRSFVEVGEGLEWALELDPA